LAGYKKPRQQGSRLLTFVDVAGEISRRLNESAMKSDEVLARLTSHGRIDMGPYLDPVICEHCGSVNQLRVNWDKLKADGLTHLIKSITPTKYGDKIEFHDAQSALGMVGKAHGLFKERHEIGLDDPTRQLLAQIGLLAAACITDPAQRERFESELGKMMENSNG